MAYTGRRASLPILINGLKKLEYRGYDSSGIALLNAANELRVIKKSGRLENLSEILQCFEIENATQGIGHTRWATHGAPTDQNSHPHLDQSGRLALVHNGVIENFQEIKRQLIEAGHQFCSETDSEVLAHYIGKLYKLEYQKEGIPGLLKAMRKALRSVQGTYGIAMIHADYPGYLFGARFGSPLVIGVGKEENFLSSDMGPIVGHTRQAVYLQDRELTIVTPNSFHVETLDGISVDRKFTTTRICEEDTELGEYPHYMLKEIFEQPRVVVQTMRERLWVEEGTIRLPEINMTSRELKHIDRVVITGCGSAYHAGAVGEYLLEGLSRLPVEVEISSEFRYRNVPADRNTMQIVISQSGETIDSLAAVREGQRKGYRVLAVVNQPESTIARECDGCLYMNVGPEIGVAATKTFSSQVLLLSMMALSLGRLHHVTSQEGVAVLRELERVPAHLEKILRLAPQVEQIAKKYLNSQSMLFLGRQSHYPVALEAALKVKEIGDLNASGHPTAELKHGIIALVKPEVPCFVLIPDDTVYEKNRSNIEEIKARGGSVIAITSEGRDELERLCDDVIYLPQSPWYVQPILSVVPLQLLAYYIGIHRGCDVDRPRNLAKSVTVE